ncbi:MAG: porin [Betaproteobacteria bacterium]|nr:MAG: porin [Betaproteobacteria bacterium]
MKKSYLVGAVLAAVGGVASAQSSVTVFGFIEAQVGRQTQNAPGTKLFDMGGSRLGFKGDEARVELTGAAPSPSGRGRKTGILSSAPWSPRSAGRRRRTMRPVHGAVRRRGCVAP